VGNGQKVPTWLWQFQTESSAQALQSWVTPQYSAPVHILVTYVHIIRQRSPRCGHMPSLLPHTSRSGYCNNTSHVSKSLSSSLLNSNIFLVFSYIHDLCSSFTYDTEFHNPTEHLHNYAIYTLLHWKIFLAGFSIIVDHEPGIQKAKEQIQETYKRFLIRFQLLNDVIASANYAASCVIDIILWSAPEGQNHFFSFIHLFATNPLQGHKTHQDIDIVQCHNMKYNYKPSK
jgi:hypothetical protein